MINIIALGVSDTDTHVTETNVLGGNRLVQASCKDDTTLQQTGQDIGRGQTLGQVHGGHAVGLRLRARSDLLQTELGNGSLDLVRDLGMLGEAAGDIGGDLREGSVQGVNKLGGRSGEVGRLVVFVVHHDGQPVGDGGVVGAGWGLAGLGDLDGAAGGHDDAETGRAADGLLGGSDDGIEIPLVEGDLLRAHGADTINDHEGLGADAADQLGHTLDVGEDTSGGVDVGQCDELVGLLLQGLLDLLEGGTLADGGGEVGDVGAVGFEALAEGIAEVASVEDESILTPLDQVGGDKVPSEGSAAGDDEGLSGRGGGLEELAGESQGLAEDLDEAGCDVALTGNN